MAVAPIPPIVSVDEYLNSSYRPDLEFVDGALIEGGIPTVLRGLLQAILIRYFAQFQSSLHFATLPEVRMQIVPHARYRIPDVMLCPAPVHLEKGPDIRSLGRLRDHVP